MNKMQKAAKVITKTQDALGELSKGQMVDLLLANMPELKDSNEARDVVEKLSKYVKGLADYGSVNKESKQTKLTKGQLKEIIKKEIIKEQLNKQTKTKLFYSLLSKYDIRKAVIATPEGEPVSSSDHDMLESAMKAIWNAISEAFTKGYREGLEDGYQDGYQDGSESD